MQPRYSTLTLSDGRSLAWVEYGPTDGRPVLYLHGGNDCGIEAGWFADSLDGIRIVAPDRPGFGGSTMQPGRRFADVVADTHELLDHLELSQVVAFGLSGGGPHTLALAAGSHRVTRIGVVCGPCPFATPGFLRGTWLPIRIAYLTARYAPEFALRGLQRAMNDPERNMRYAERMPDPDARLLAEDSSRKDRVIESVSRAHAQGFDGAVHEWRLYTRPWGFELEDVRVPTTLWYGGLDGMAPVQMGETLHSRIAGSRLRVLEEEGHLSLIHRHAKAIVDDLFESDRSVPGAT